MTEDKSNRLVSEDDLLAFADGVIDPAQRAIVADAIARDPELAATVAAFRRQTTAMKQALEPILDEPVPQRLLSTVQNRPNPKSWLQAAAACLIFVVGASAGWTGRDAVGIDPLTMELGQRGALAFATFAQGDQPAVDVSPEAISTGGWLTETLGREARTPNLAPLGFVLIGGRLMMGETQPAVLLVFRNREDRRLSIFIRSDLDPDVTTPVHHVLTPQHPAAYWVKDATGMSISGNVDLKILLSAAKATQEQDLL